MSSSSEDSGVALNTSGVKHHAARRVPQTCELQQSEQLAIAILNRVIIHARVSTTTIFAEIFVSGVQASVWLVLLGMSFARSRPQLEDLAKLKDWTALLTLVGIALVYAIGVLADRLADGMTDWADRRIADRHYKGAVSVGEARLRIARDSDGLTKYLEYIRNRMRVARATLFNAVCFTIASVVFACCVHLSGSGAAGLVISGVAVTGVALFSWLDTSIKFYTRLTQAFDLATKEAK
jgi:hypothetical protein